MSIYNTELVQEQETRSKRLKRNAIGSVAVKISTMLVEVLKVPIMLSYLDVEKYGIWLTIVSIVLWTHHFDFGLGAGLKYKLTEAIANNNYNRAKHLVSTAYVSMSIIMGIVLLIMTPIIYNVNWHDLLNVSSPSVSNIELQHTVFGVLIVFIFQFILSLIGVVLQSYQRTALSEVFKPIGSFISLGLVLVIGLFSHNSLIIASLVMVAPYVVILIILNLFFFKGIYSKISPSIKWAKKSYLTDIYSLGVKFFINQLSSLIVFATANFILSSMINPSEVSIYSTARTYYGIVLIFLTSILVSASTPITDAFVRKDYQWIKQCMNRLYKVAYLAIILEIFILTISDFAFQIWVGDKLVVPISLAIAFVIFNTMAFFTQQFSHFLISVGKMNLNVIISCCKIIAFIPVAIILVKVWGAVGLVITTIIVNTLPNLIFGGIQYKKIISGTAKGIWNK